MTRGRVHRLAADGRVPQEFVAKAGDRWMLDPEFVERVGVFVDAGKSVPEAIELASR